MRGNKNRPRRIHKQHQQHDGYVYVRVTHGDEIFNNDACTDRTGILFTTPGRELVHPYFDGQPGSRIITSRRVEAAVEDADYRERCQAEGLDVRYWAEGTMGQPEGSVAVDDPNDEQSAQGGGSLREAYGRFKTAQAKQRRDTVAMIENARVVPHACSTCANDDPALYGHDNDVPSLCEPPLAGPGTEIDGWKARDRQRYTGGFFDASRGRDCNTCVDHKTAGGLQPCLDCQSYEPSLYTKASCGTCEHAKLPSKEPPCEECCVDRVFTNYVRKGVTSGVQ